MLFVVQHSVTRTYGEAFVIFHLDIPSYTKRTPDIALEIMTMWGTLRLVPTNLARGKLKASPITDTSIVTNT